MSSTLFFAANHGVHGYELWRSDGTAAGTKMVKRPSITPAGGLFDGQDEAPWHVWRLDLGMPVADGNGPRLLRNLVAQAHRPAFGIMESIEWSIATNETGGLARGLPFIIHDLTANRPKGSVPPWPRAGAARVDPGRSLPGCPLSGRLLLRCQGDALGVRLLD